jgi:hypothetical protein
MAAGGHGPRPRLGDFNPTLAVSLFGLVADTPSSSSLPAEEKESSAGALLP